MAKGRTQARRPVDAVRTALSRESARRDDLKPIEVVKIAVAAYLAHTQDDEGDPEAPAAFESPERAALRRGNYAAVDALLFNANYWRAAYEDRLCAICDTPESAAACLSAVTVWNKNTLRLNRLSPDEVQATFERFCPPFAANQRRGSHESARGGKGPLPQLRQAVRTLEGNEHPDVVEGLRQLLHTMEAEASTYEALGANGSLSALFDVLPAWCLQNRIELVSGGWWDDSLVMGALIDALTERFRSLNFFEPACQYFSESCYEALDAYHRDLSAEPSELCELDVPTLVSLVREARTAHPGFETDGYDDTLPPWLASKEQLIWNIVVCAVFGPASARPLLMDSPDLLANQGYTAKTDVITELAQTSFTRYTADRVASQAAQDYPTFASLPPDLRDSSIAYISSIHDKLATLGYEVLPAGSCYPERYVAAFTASEVECLAILEHRRWLREREGGGLALRCREGCRGPAQPLPGSLGRAARPRQGMEPLRRAQHSRPPRQREPGRGEVGGRRFRRSSGSPSSPGTSWMAESSFLLFGAATHFFTFTARKCDLLKVSKSTSSSNSGSTTTLERSMEQRPQEKLRFGNIVPGDDEHDRLA